MLNTNQMFKKKAYTAALFHDLNFGFCPDKQHSHSSKIEITGVGDFESFFIDSIIPCDTNSIESFLDIINQECKNAKINLVSAELYLEDTGVHYIKFFNTENNS